MFRYVLPAALLIAGATTLALAQTPRPSVQAPTMEKRTAHYVEGAGYVTFFHRQTPGYGGTYPECERHCLADARCRMIEFYKPLKKCHLYDHSKISGKSGDADVALKLNPGS